MIVNIKFSLHIPAVGFMGLILSQVKEDSWVWFMVLNELQSLSLPHDRLSLFRLISCLHHCLQPP